MITAGLIMALTVAGAIIAVGAANIVHAIFGLAIGLLGVAGTFLVLGSPFVAVMEVLIYVGGISVAMVFAVMLSSIGKTDAHSGSGRKFLAAAASVSLFVGIALVLTSADFTTRAVPPPMASSVHHLGIALLDRYNLIFETLSVVLLVAIIGAITIARTAPEDSDTKGQSS